VQKSQILDVFQDRINFFFLFHIGILIEEFTSTVSDSSDNLVPVHIKYS